MHYNVAVTLYYNHQALTLNHPEPEQLVVESYLLERSYHCCMGIVSAVEREKEIERVRE